MGTLRRSGWEGGGGTFNGTEPLLFTRSGQWKEAFFVCSPIIQTKANTQRKCIWPENYLEYLKEFRVFKILCLVVVSSIQVLVHLATAPDCLAPMHATAILPMT